MKKIEKLKSKPRSKKAGKGYEFLPFQLRIPDEESADATGVAPPPLSLDEKLAGLPVDPGIYLMKDGAGAVIYIGKAKNLRSRVRSYFQDQASHSAKTTHLVSRISSFDLLKTSNETEALILENEFIKKYRPKYNIRLKDDKTYPFIKLDLKHPFPRAYIARRQVYGDGCLYLGPFPASGSLRSALSVAAKIFKIRDCRDHEFSNRVRPCISFEMGACTAPCVGKVGREQYAQQINDFQAFLKGEDEGLLKVWEVEMTKASEALDFERAGGLRDRIAAFRLLHSLDQRVVSTEGSLNQDVWALYPENPREWVRSDFVLVLILQIRDGKLVGTHARSADLTEVVDDENLVEHLLFQHYAKFALPNDLVLPAGLELEKERIALSEGLTHLREKILLKARNVGSKQKAIPGAESVLVESPEMQMAVSPNPMEERLSGSEATTSDRLKVSASVDDALFHAADSDSQIAQSDELLQIKFVDEKETLHALYQMALENARTQYRELAKSFEKKSDALAAIADLLELPEPPRRLECIDISNMQGEANVASAVVFINGQPDKSEYRHYKIQGFDGQNDFASMKEVISRRFGKPDSPRPDLLVIDGGRGQVAAVIEILNELQLKLPIVGLAKARVKSDFQSSEVESSEERLFLPNQKNYLRIKNVEALKVLTFLRDEAHRFAIEFHRKKRSENRGFE